MSSVWLNEIHNQFTVIKNHERISKSGWLDQIHRIRDHILNHYPALTGRKCFLDIRDRYLFSILFFSLLEAGVKPVLIPVEIKIEDLQSEMLPVISDHRELPGSITADPELMQLQLNGQLPDGDPDTTENSFYLYTSGSTGRAKLIGKKKIHLDYELNELSRIFKIQPGNRLFCIPPLYHIYGLLFGLLFPGRAGAEVYMDYIFTPESIAGYLKDCQIQTLISIPSYYRMFDTLNLYSYLKGVTILTSSSAPLEMELSKRFYDHGLPVTEIYGSTETGGIAYRVASIDPAWCKFSHVTIHEVKEEGQSELVIDSPAISSGSQTGYHTGDLAQFPEPGQFILTGRNTRFVKISGKRLDLKMVEEKIKVTWYSLYQEDLLSEKMIILEKYELLFVFIDTELKFSVKDLIREIRKHLPGYAVPRYWFASEIIKNAMGKINKNYYDNLIENLQIKK